MLLLRAPRAARRSRTSRRGRSACAAPRIVVCAGEVGVDVVAARQVVGALRRAADPPRVEQSVQAPSSQSRPKLNVPDPSTKNGRRSVKNVSNADRLTTAGSASTWPKSGLTVPVNVRPGVSAYFTSRPSAAAGVRRFTQRVAVGRLPRQVRDRVGHQLEPLRRRRPSTGRRARRTTRRSRWRCAASSGQVDVSFSRPISRDTAKPNVVRSRGLNRSCENGIRNSAGPAVRVARRPARPTPRPSCRRGCCR